MNASEKRLEILLEMLEDAKKGETIKEQLSKELILNELYNTFIEEAKKRKEFTHS